MDVLLIGGSNFLGRHIAKQAREAGHDLTFLTRGRSPLPDGFNRIVGDRSEASVLDAAAKRHFDVVVDNVAYRGSDVDGAVRAFRGRTSHYIMTSSAAVYLTGGRPPYSEEAAPVDPSSAEYPDTDFNDYIEGKLSAEWSLVHTEGLRYSIVRPPVIIGPHDPTHRLHYYVERVIAGGPVLLSGGGRHCYHLAGAGDVAAVICRLFDVQADGPQIFNVCQPDVVTQREMIVQIAAALGHQAQLIDVAEERLASAGFQYWDPMGPAEPFHRNFITPPRRVEDELGPSLRSVAEVIKEAARWHEAHSPRGERRWETRPAEIELGCKLLEHSEPTHDR